MSINSIIWFLFFVCMTIRPSVPVLTACMLQFFSRSVCDRYGNPKRLQRPSFLKMHSPLFLYSVRGIKNPIRLWRSLERPFFGAVVLAYLYICIFACMFACLHGSPRTPAFFGTLFLYSYILIFYFMYFLAHLSPNSLKSHDSMLLPLSDNLLLCQRLLHLPHW